jgi:hypothetical protein
MKGDEIEASIGVKSIIARSVVLKIERNVSKIKNRQGSRQRQWPSGDQCQKGNVNNDPRVDDFNLLSFKIGTISHIKSENRFIFPLLFTRKGQK